MDNKEIFESIWVYAAKTRQAVLRCEQIAADEEICGYQETADLYHLLSSEAEETRAWHEKVLRSYLEQVV